MNLRRYDNENSNKQSVWRLPVIKKSVQRTKNLPTIPLSKAIAVSNLARLKNGPVISGWETPEQYHKRTGEPWPENGAVYYQQRIKLCNIKNGEILDSYWSDFLWEVTKWSILKKLINSKLHDRKYIDYGMVICATESGPPPEKWEPGDE
jgi:hypothetical protein